MLKKTSGATTAHKYINSLYRQLSEKMTCFKRFPFPFPFLIYSCVLFCIKRHCS